MTKSKSREEAPQDFLAEEAPPTPEALTKEQALQARVAELEALLAKQPPAEGAESAAPAEALPKWRVELQHAPTLVVEARDGANAWEEYKRRLGVRSSEYTPSISPA